MYKYKTILIVITLSLILTFVLSFGLWDSKSYAQPEFPIPNINLNIDEAQDPGEVATSIEVLVLLTILSLAPSILIMMTCFTRIIIVLSFLRRALSTQSTPPNQVLIGLALFLTFFVMGPVFQDINDNAVQPYLNEDITFEEGLEKTFEPLREFMFRQTRQKDIALFVNVMGMDEPPNKLQDIPTRALIPAFIISELKTGFGIGFLLFIPFIVIDMVVASTLMSMGMMMLPPVMISLPFKILLFIMIDGWNLIVKHILLGFN